MINVAVIGAGAISSFHIEGYLAFPDRCRIVSVVDIDRARAERQIARYRLGAVAADDIGQVLSGSGAGARVTLPLEDRDPFCTRDGLLAAAPHFYEKKVSVADFGENEITTTAGQR